MANDVGFTHATMGTNKGSETAKVERSKHVLSSDRQLEFDPDEVGIARNAGSAYTGVEHVPGRTPPVSYRIVFTRSPWPTCKEGAVEGEGVGMEVVTR